MYKENWALELIDIYVVPSCDDFDLSHVQRCIHVRLLCVQ